MTPTKFSVAFYKANSGNLFDKLIGVYTHGKYSHCEFILEDTCNLCVSSSPRDGGVRTKIISDLKSSGNWDIITINFQLDFLKYTKFYINNIGKRYDWLGILLSQVFPLKIDDPNKWFCSEFIVKLLICGGFQKFHKHPAQYHPNSLYDCLIKHQ